MSELLHRSNTTPLQTHSRAVCFSSFAFFRLAPPPPAPVFALACFCLNSASSSAVSSSGSCTPPQNDQNVIAMCAAAAAQGWEGSREVCYRCARLYPLIRLMERTCSRWVWAFSHSEPFTSLAGSFGALNCTCHNSRTAVKGGER